MKKRIAMFLALGMLAAFIGGCNSASNANSGNSNSGASSAASSAASVSNGPIRIGALMPVTGNLSSDGENMVNAIKLAIKHRNEAGGVLGRQIELDVQDSASTPDTAVNAANKVLPDTSYDVVFGPHYSAHMLAIADLINDTEALQITGATNDTVLQQVTSPYTVRNRIPDVYTSQAAAVYLAEELGCKNVGILCLNDDFGETARRLASEYFDSVGVSYVTEIYGNDDKDVTTQILNLRNANVDGLLVWSYNDIFVLLARQLYELGMSDIPAINNGAITAPDVLARMEPDWYDGWYALAQWNPDDTEPGSVSFKESYTNEYGKGPNFLGACWYSATVWYLDCVEKAGSVDKEAVLAAMKETKDYVALNGIYNWDNRDICKSIKIAQIDKDGMITTLETLTF